MTRIALFVSAALLLLAPARLVAAAPPKFNVLFIAVDDLRTDLGCYGNTVIKTPHLDQLAARGIVFTHAYCQQAVCSPSRTSLMTGRRPDATRVYDLVTHFRAALPNAVTLPQHFKANGYYCAALGKIYHHGYEDGRSWNEPHWYPGGQTIDTDPTDWRKRIVGRAATAAPAKPAKKDPPAAADDKKAGDAGAPRKTKSAKGPAFVISEASDEELPDGQTATEAVRRLHDLKAKGQPFFLAVGFLKPHLPFIAPKKYWDLYDPDKIPLPASGMLPEGAPKFTGHSNGELHSYAGVPEGNPIPADFAKRLRHGYYAASSYTDAQIGRVLEALKSEGLAEDTVVVLWGDHGWQLGDHGLWHKHTNFEQAVHAPLLLSVPGQKSAGKKCNATVEFVDIYPTLADVCGLAVPPGLDGASLKPFLENPERPSDKVAISQYPRGGNETGGKSLMGYSIRDDRWRLTLWRDRQDGNIAATELYDEVNDPAEAVNLASKPEHKETVARLSQHLPPLPKDASTAGKAAASSATDREALFDNKDKDKNGELAHEEFMANQPDGEAAKTRFTQFDTDKNGRLSRAEFVRAGKAVAEAK